MLQGFILKLRIVLLRCPVPAHVRLAVWILDLPLDQLSLNVKNRRIAYNPLSNNFNFPAIVEQLPGREQYDEETMMAASHKNTCVYFPIINYVVNFCHCCEGINIFWGVLLSLGYSVIDYFLWQFGMCTGRSTEDGATGWSLKVMTDDPMDLTTPAITEVSTHRWTSMQSFQGITA